MFKRRPHSIQKPVMVILCPNIPLADNDKPEANSGLYSSLQQAIQHTHIGKTCIYIVTFINIEINVCARWSSLFYFGPNPFPLIWGSSICTREQFLLCSISANSPYPQVYSMNWHYFLRSFCAVSVLNRFFPNDPSKFECNSEWLLLPLHLQPAMPDSDSGKVWSPCSFVNTQFKPLSCDVCFNHKMYV